MAKLSSKWSLAKYMDYLSKRKQKGDLSEAQYLRQVELVQATEVKRVKPNKYNAQKVEIDGIRFDSKMEAVVYNLSKKLKLPYETQYRIEVGFGFEYKGARVRARFATWDFSYRFPFGWILLDCKGMKRKGEGFGYRVYLTKATFKDNVEAPSLYVIYKGEEQAWCLALLKCQKEQALTAIAKWQI